MAVNFDFNGGSTLATTFDAAIGDRYLITINDPTSTVCDDFATASLETWSVTDIDAANPGRHYLISLVDKTTGAVQALAILEEGTTAEYVSPIGVTFTYDGALHAEVTFTDPGGRNWVFEVLDSDYNGLGVDFAIGTGSPQTITVDFSAPFAADLIFNLYSSTVGEVRDWAAVWVTPGSTTIHHSAHTWGGTPVTPPTNDSCANADVLAGLAGSVATSNEGWAGTWPTGTDPLFEFLGYGGGAPLWWKWTNPTPQKLLFRVSTVAAVHNLNMALVKGVCGSQIVDVADLSFSDVWQTNSSPPDTIDIVVEPGETVYLEVDTYSGDATEPPTALEGAFSFDWSALTVTFSDTLDVSTVVADVTSGGSGLFRPLASAVFDDRVYMAWALDDALWAGSCALDGTDLNTDNVGDFVAGGGAFTGAGTTPSLVDNDVDFKLVYDGINVYLGHGRITSGFTNPEHDCAHSGVGDPVAHQNTYRLYQFAADGSSCAMIWEFTQDGTGLNDGPDWGRDTISFVSRLAASPVQPGVVWMIWNTQVYHEVWQEYVCMTTLGPAYSCVIQSQDYYDTRKTLCITPADLATSLAAATVFSDTVFGDTMVESYLSDYICHGDLPPEEITTYLGQYTAGGAEAVAWGNNSDLNNDLGYPVLTGAAPLTWGSSMKTWDDAISAYRVDSATWTLLSRHIYDDFAGVTDPDVELRYSDAGFGSDGGYGQLQSVRVHSQFVDVEVGSAQKRLVWSGWDAGVGADPASPLSLLGELNDDFTGLVSLPAVGESASASVITGGVQDYAWAFHKDGVRDIYGFDNRIAARAIQYDRTCLHTWLDVHTEAGGVYWIPDQESWTGDTAYVLNSAKAVEKFLIARYAAICAIGGPPSGGAVLRVRFKAAHTETGGASASTAEGVFPQGTHGFRSGEESVALPPGVTATGVLDGGPLFQAAR